MSEHNFERTHACRVMVLLELLWWNDSKERAWYLEWTLRFI